MRVIVHFQEAIIQTELLSTHKRGKVPIEDNSSDKISAFLNSMSRPSDDSLSFLEFLNIAHALSQTKKDMSTLKWIGKSIYQILYLNQEAHYKF